MSSLDRTGPATGVPKGQKWQDSLKSLRNLSRVFSTMVRKASLRFLDSYHIHCENYCLLFLSPQARKVLWILSFFNAQGKSSVPSIIWNRKIIATVPVIQIPHRGLYQTLAERLKTRRVRELETMSGCEPQVGFISLQERCSVQIHASETWRISNRNWLCHTPNVCVTWTSAPEWGCSTGTLCSLLLGQLAISQSTPISKQPHKQTKRLYLLRQADHQVIFRLSNKHLPEVFTACSQHSPVGPELLPLHDQSHVTENILFPLVIEAQEDVGAVDCGLIHIHGGVRLLIHRHAVHTLQERRAGLPQLLESEREGENFTAPASHCREPGRKDQNCSLV